MTFLFGGGGGRSAAEVAATAPVAGAEAAGIDCGQAGPSHRGRLAGPSPGQYRTTPGPSRPGRLYRLASGELSTAASAPQGSLSPSGPGWSWIFRIAQCPVALLFLDQAIAGSLVAGSGRDKEARRRPPSGLQLLLEDGERHHASASSRPEPTLESFDLCWTWFACAWRAVSLSAPRGATVPGTGGSAGPLRQGTEISWQQNPRPRHFEAALALLWPGSEAEFGTDSVRSVRLKSGHLPEARFEWRPFKGLLLGAVPGRSPCVPWCGVSTPGPGFCQKSPCLPAKLGAERDRPDWNVCWDDLNQRRMVGIERYGETTGSSTPAGEKPCGSITTNLGDAGSAQGRVE